MPGSKSAASTAVRGAALTLSGRGMRLLCQLAGLIILARYLTPTDYGLVAMASAIIGVASVLGDFGVSLSALRSPTLTIAERNSLFWLSTGLGFACTIIVAGLGPVLAIFYRQPAVLYIILALSPIFIFGGATAQYKVDAARRGRYLWIASAETLSSVLGLIVGVVVAVSGFGFWALVLQTWTVSLVGLVIIVYAGGWSPGLPTRGGQLRHHVKFGSFSTLTQTANYISANVDSVALGRFLGPAAVGTYSRAYQLFSLPVDQIAAPLTQILLPLLAKIDRERLPEVLLRVQRCLVYGVLGICLFMAVGGSPMAIVLLGPEWSQVGTLVQLLLVGAVFQLSGYVYYWAFLTTGRMELLFWCEVPARFVMTAMVVVGASYGLWGAALGHSLGLFVCWLSPAIFGVRKLGWKVSRLALGSVRPVILYMFAYCVGATVRDGLARYSIGPLPILAAAIGSAAFAVALGLIIPAYRRDMSELLRLASSVRQNRL